MVGDTVVTRQSPPLLPQLHRPSDPVPLSGVSQEKNKLNIDPYHYLSCTRHKRQEITIGHNILVHVVYTYNNYTGGTGVKEPSDLHGSDHRRPDLQMVVNNTHILTDIQITNPLCPCSWISSTTATCCSAQRENQNQEI